MERLDTRVPAPINIVNDKTDEKRVDTLERLLRLFPVRFSFPLIIFLIFTSYTTKSVLIMLKQAAIAIHFNSYLFVHLHSYGKALREQFHLKGI